MWATLGQKFRSRAKTFENIVQSRDTKLMPGLFVYSLLIKRLSEFERGYIGLDFK